VIGAVLVVLESKILDAAEVVDRRPVGRPYSAIMKVWSRLRQAAGVPFLRIHDLRHQYASFLVNSGRTLYEVQQILGHADSSVTQRYAHLTSETLQAAANSASVAIQAATTTTIEIGI
jgi:integrase